MSRCSQHLKDCQLIEELDRLLVPQPGECSGGDTSPVAYAEIEALMVVSGHSDVVLEEDDRVFEYGDSFKSYHHQA